MLNRRNYRLSNHSHAQCHVTIWDAEEPAYIIEFWSYRTKVISAKRKPDGTYELSCTGTYSPTTAHQIGWFLKEYFGDLGYYDMKRIAGTEETICAERKHAKYW